VFDVYLENEQGSIVNINDTIRYEVIGISGLNPPSATLYASKSPNRKGAKYNGSSLDVRNIVIDIKILGDIESNRNYLYSWVDSESYCKIRFKNTLKNVYCEGYVVECPIDMFTDNEVVSVAIQCPDSYFKDLQAISTEIAKYSKQFSFPFSIEQKEVMEYTTTLPDGETVVKGTFNRGIPFSTIKGDVVTKVFNSGVLTGMVIEVVCKGTVENLEIYDGEFVHSKLQFKYKFPGGSTIVIDTESSPKKARATLPDGTIVNLMKHIVGTPTWLTLKKGENSIGHRSDSDYSTYTLTVKHTNKYLGI
jgi:hypothetical protein